MTRSTTLYSDLFLSILLAYSQKNDMALDVLVGILLAKEEPIQPMYTEEEWDLLSQIIEEVACG